MSERIVLLGPFPAEVLRERFPDTEVVEAGDDAAAACEGARFVLADWTGRHHVSGAVIDALAPTCALVQAPSAGLDSVDLAGLRAAGVPVAGAAGLNREAVAEWCVWAVIEGSRRLRPAIASLRRGAWDPVRVGGHELFGRTVGIVGLGEIGTAVARRLAGFGVTLTYTSGRRRPAHVEEELGLTWYDLDELVEVSEVLILACGLTDATRGLLSADRVDRLPEGAVVVNAARGEIVDEEALAAALDRGGLHAVVTDVFAAEPPAADHPLITHEHATATPHLAGGTPEGMHRIGRRIVRNVAAVLDGRRPEGLVG